jgi:sRNA-binding regulator protein Hfq
MESSTSHRVEPLAPPHVSPHAVELIRYRDNRTPLIFKLVTGDEFRGAIRWFDDTAIRIVQEDRSEVTLYQQAIAYFRQQPR